MTARVYGSFEPVLRGFPIDIEGAAVRSGEHATTMTSIARLAATRRIGPSAGVDVHVQPTRDPAFATAQRALRKRYVTTSSGRGSPRSARPGTARDDDQIAISARPFHVHTAVTGERMH